MRKYASISFAALLFYLQPLHASEPEVVTITPTEEPIIVSTEETVQPPPIQATPTPEQTTRPKRKKAKKIQITSEPIIAQSEPIPPSEPIIEKQEESTTLTKISPIIPFDAFTGKISKNKVRMRVQPSLESAIVRELNKDELLIITGENEDFYEAKPPAETKSYIYRTYVLDNTIEGNRVNVRLEPDTDSIVIAQLNNGDKINGNISSLNSKWYEIETPDNVRFYICKEYVEKIGDPSMMTNMDKRRQEVNQLLETTYTLSRLEMQKNFDEIALDDINHNLDVVVNDYPEFHEQAGRAKALQQSLKEQYLEKKIAYLEVKAQTLPQLLAEKKKAEPTTVVAQLPEPKLEPHITQWLPVENSLYTAWASENFNKSLSDFYEQQRQEAITLHGIIEPYNRPVRNKPGDYVLLSRANRLPVAFLYSTIIDLQHYADQEVTLKGVPRPNNNFAFPAYFILAIE